MRQPPFGEPGTGPRRPDRADRVGRLPAGEDGADVVGQHVHDSGLALLGDARDVRGEHDAGQPFQPTGGGGFVLTDVEARTGQAPTLQGVGESVLVDDLAPADVDEKRCGLHQGQQPCVDQVTGVRCRRQVAAEDVSGRDDLLEGGDPDADPDELGIIGPDERVVGDGLHPKSHRRPGGRARGGAGAEHAPDATGEFTAGAPLPSAVSAAPVEVDEMACQREGQPDRVFGDTDRIGAERGDHDHTKLVRSRNVDVVQADPGAADHQQLRAGRQQVAVDARAVPHHEGTRLAAHGHQIRR